jgi:hypothetical protein
MSELTGMLPIAEYGVTCRTPGCENQGVTLRVMATVGAEHVVCGPCGNHITDCVEATQPSQTS